ncbi:TMEM43 family protein [Frateuria defendens]|uniref:TMEM43 family protein n=1 Tax=Frateuria defendens TaxID=2219559 RepID=UPI00066FEC07|nr:TMEM43 family protein [Frateuria defendens]
MIRYGGVALGTLALKAAGALLLLAGIALAAMTERGLLQYRAAIERHGGQVEDLGAAGPVGGLYGGMARVSGPLEVVQPARDPDFGLEVPTPLLTRRVEMFQWREVRVGEAVHYELDWVDHPLDATDFKQPAGHVNPGAFPLEGRRFEAGEVRVGGYALSAPLLRALPGAEPVAAEAARLPPNLAASFGVYQGHLVTSANPAHPRLGDLRVSWEQVPQQMVTIFARPADHRLVPAADAPDGRGFDVQVGERGLTDLLPDVPEPPASVQPRRLAALLLGALGVLALLWAHRRRDVWLALGVGAAAVAAVAAAVWLGGDPAMSLGWFAVAAVGVGLAVWRQRRGG